MPMLLTRSKIAYFPVPKVACSSPRFYFYRLARLSHGRCDAVVV